MAGWFGDLDSLLRGEKTKTLGVSDAGEHVGGVPIARWLALTVVLAAIYGAAMGLFAALGWREHSGMQLIAATVKMPALFLLTLLITFPSLYVFSVLAGSQLRCRVVLRLLLAAIIVTVTVAASLAPILAFFTLSTESYPFMVVLNVLLLGIAGVIGIGFLRRALNQLMRNLAVAEAQMAPPPAKEPDEPHRRIVVVNPTRTFSPGVVTFRVWMIIYGLVGAQMGWVLRPFIGSPNIEFTWFRPREGSFFKAVAYHLGKLFAG